MADRSTASRSTRISLLALAAIAGSAFGAPLPAGGAEGGAPAPSRAARGPQAARSGMSAASSPAAAVGALATLATSCAPDATTMCLGPAGRFQVQAAFKDYSGNAGQAKVQKLTDLSGYLYFGDPANVELVAKFVSFCSGTSGNWAIYASGLTDVEVTFMVTDTSTGLYKEYKNPLGNRFCTIGDGPFTCPAGLAAGELPAAPAPAPAAAISRAVAMLSELPDAPARDVPPSPAADNPSFRDIRTSLTAPGTGCTAPAAVSTFSVTDRAVYLYFMELGVAAGESATFKFIDPTGTVYESERWSPAIRAGDYCFWAWMNLAGTPAADLPGTWRVVVQSTRFPGENVVDLAFVVQGSSANGCAFDATTMCLGPSGRFKVQASFVDYSGNGGQAKVQKLTDLSGYLYFGDSANVELVAKFVNFCSGGSGNWALYASGLTDVDVTFKVTDTATGLYKEYKNPLGNRFCTIGDGPFTCP